MKTVKSFSISVTPSGSSFMKLWTACAKEYAALQMSAASAAKRGYVDQIIEPADTRKYIIGAFEMLFTKREDRPAKKHGTV